MQKKELNYQFTKVNSRCSQKERKFIYFSYKISLKIFLNYEISDKEFIKEFKLSDQVLV